MRLHIDKMRLKRALNQTFPASTDPHFEQDDEVLVWREKVH